MIKKGKEDQVQLSWQKEDRETKNHRTEQGQEYQIRIERKPMEKKEKCKKP